jgi:predicted AlkP superfamily phosphohydrolase/phosphomutase
MTSKDRRRVIVLGIDGGTLSLVGPWAKQGELPNLARIIAAGTSGALRSTVHPLTPQAWTSFLTGVNPGKHGVFDFGRRRPDSYQLDLVDSRSRRAPAIWSYLAEHGLTTGVINVPLTFPLEEIHGFQISGMHTPSLEQGVGPVRLLDELREVAPDYQIDVMSPWYDDMGAFLRDVHRMTVARGRAAVHLYREHRPDLFVLVLVAVDRVSHALFGQMAHPANHGRDGRAGWKYSGEVLRAYQAVDRVLGELLALADENTVVVVMSDHGFGDLARDVSLNQFFLERGLMAFSPDKVRPRLPVVGVPVGAAGRTAAEAVVERIRQAVPPLRWAADRQIRRGAIPLALRRWEYIDWSRTVAYSHGFFGNVYLNVKGREPEGCVDPADYTRVRDEVARTLAALTDPDDGGRIVDHLFRREELYSGPYLDQAPDLVVVMRGYSYITRGGSELTATAVVGPPKVGHSGNHRLDGMLVLWGAGIRQGAKVSGAHIVDVAPTILHLLGIPVPQELDGRVLAEALERPEHLVSLARRLLVPLEDRRRLTAAEERLVRRRLRNLGYFE